MPELPSDAHSSGSNRSARRHVARRYLTGLSAAGLTAALALTVAVGDASASPSAKPAARVVTLTSSSSSPTGHLTVQVKYQLEPRGRNKLMSVTFTGASKISLRHPALILSLRPVPVPPFVHRSGGGAKQTPFHPFILILRIRDARKFSGALSARTVASISKFLARRHRFIPVDVLTANVGSVRRIKHHVSITAPAGLELGVLLGPAVP